MTGLRVLNRHGVEAFRAYLGRLHEGAPEAPPAAMLESDEFTARLPLEIEVEQRQFRDRCALGEYLCAVLKPLSQDIVERNTGLWCWLSLFWFDQVCPARDDGTRRPGREYRHIPEFSFRHEHRHLLLGPYHVYRRHGAISMVLLSGAAHGESSIYHEISSRRDLIANRGVIEAALYLYTDPQRGTVKRGAQSKGAVPGTVQRFVRVLQQLDLTYDIYGLSGRQLVSLLPAEFDAFRPLQRTLHGESPG